MTNPPSRPPIDYVKDLVPSFSSIGGYAIIYLTKDKVICPDCVNGHNDFTDEDKAEIIRHDVYWEGPTIQCDNCNCDLESEYGDPEEKEEKNNA